MDHLKVTWKSIVVAETCWNPLFRFRKGHIPYYDSKFLNSQCWTPTININISTWTPALLSSCHRKTPAGSRIPWSKESSQSTGRFPSLFTWLHRKYWKNMAAESRLVTVLFWSIFGMSNFTFKIFQVPVGDYKYIPIYPNSWVMLGHQPLKILIFRQVK